MALLRRFFESIFVLQVYFIVRLLVFGTTMTFLGYRFGTPALQGINQELVGWMLIPLSMLGVYGLIWSKYWANMGFMSGFFVNNAFFLFQFIQFSSYHFVGFWFYLIDLLAAAFLIYRLIHAHKSTLATNGNRR